MRCRKDFTENVPKPINTNANEASNGQDMSITGAMELKLFSKVENYVRIPSYISEYYV